MIEIGYTTMTEQRSPKDLIRDFVAAEEAGFDFSVTSDHFHPWLEEQGHSPNAWAVLGAAAQATETLPLMTYVTCPIMRYHPAVVAQQAATLALLSDGRFRLGLGAGENLNEHIVGAGWPSVEVRHEMFVEAIEIIKLLFNGGYASYRGEYFDLDGAKLFDLPDTPPEIGIAASGRPSTRIAAQLGDFLIATEPKAELIRMFGEEGGDGKYAVGQIPVCWGESVEECKRVAREQFRWAATGWKVQAELPNPVNFDAATTYVREDDIAEMISCGPDPEGIVEAVRPFAEAGFTHVALVQVGQNQKEFCNFYEKELKDALKKL